MTYEILPEGSGATFRSGIFKAVNEGVYQLKINIKEPNLYKWADGDDDEITFTLIINKRVISIIAPPADIFNDGTFEPDVTFSGLVGTQKLTRGLDYTLTYLEGTGKLVDSKPQGMGTYTIVVELLTTSAIAKNYKLDTNTCAYEIYGGGLKRPTANDREVTYNSNLQSLTVTNFNAATMSFTVGGNSGATFTNGTTFSARNAGTYTLTISITDKTHYKWADGGDEDIVFTLTIHKKALTVFSPAADTFTGFTHDPDVTISGLVGGQLMSKGKDYTLSFAPKTSGSGTVVSGLPQGIGRYTITVTLLDSSVTAANYTFEVNTCDYEIYAGGLRKPTATDGDFTYNGAYQSITVSGYNSTTMTYRVQGSGALFDGATFRARNAGTYTLIIELRSNYTWEGGGSEAIEISRIVIKQADLTIKAKDMTVTYGDAVPNYTAEFKGLQGSDREFAVTFSCSYTRGSAVVAGGYVININPVRDSNYNITLVSGTLTVDPKAITLGIASSGHSYGDAPATIALEATPVAGTFVGNDSITVFAGLISF